jgi:uncharacterized integral membrane protein (TIGR00698 family)
MSQLTVSSPADKDYSWAEYLDCMEGVSDVLTLPPQARPAKSPTAETVPSAIPGVTIAVGLSVAAIYLSELPVWPFTLADKRHPIEPVMLAIILGMILSNSWSMPKSFATGIKFSVKKLLPLGIIFLGARLNFLDIVKVGFEGVALSLLETFVALSFLIFLARKMKLPSKLGLLLGVGTAICGGTAIVATAPVVEAEEKDVVFSVATVTLLGLIAMFVLPVLASLMHLSQKAFGVWAGLAIHQTPQVIAAGFAYGKDAGQVATIVKLARVCLLAPVVFLVGFLHARSKAKNGEAEKKNINYFHLFPMFVLGFLGMALLRTVGLIPDITFHLSNSALFGTGNPNVNLAAFFEDISKYCIVISMAAVGVETKFSAMKQTGAKPFVASLLAALLIGTLVLALIKALGF